MMNPDLPAEDILLLFYFYSCSLGRERVWQARPREKRGGGGDADRKGGGRERES